MNVLLDTHALLWWVAGEKLSDEAVEVLENPDNLAFVSAASIWEISIKVGLGKLSLSLPFQQWLEQAIHDLGASVLPITVEYAAVQSGLPAHHGDPFDRLLAAQAQVETVPLVSTDAVFDQYGINRVW